MKVFITGLAAITLSSCLKQSIPDAMLGIKNASKVTATLSYNIKGAVVTMSVNDADNQNPNYFTLGCGKYQGYYGLDGLSDAGEMSFEFYTDSLTTGRYVYPGSYGDMYFSTFNGEAEYVHAPTDSLSFTITSYSNGHISGYFSGALTPLVSASTLNNIYGDPGSVLITNGSFKNVPVFY